MKITFEDIKKSGNYSQTIKFDFSDMDVKDVLLQKIHYAEVEIEAYMVSSDEAFVDFDVTYNIDYLDAYNLNELNLTFNFSDNAIFTTDLQKAKELDIEYVSDEEIDLEELISNLILVDVPLNYTETDDAFTTIEEYDSNEQLQSPFANLFNKKEE